MESVSLATTLIYNLNGVDHQLERDGVVRVVAYTLDLLTVDEHRVDVETTTGVTHTFAEDDESWRDLEKWLSVSFNIDENWQATAFGKPFSRDKTVIWDAGT